jgi:predicted HAD superfamily phosphohydrolase YqeG
MKDEEYTEMERSDGRARMRWDDCAWKTRFHIMVMVEAVRPFSKAVREAVRGCNFFRHQVTRLEMSA